MKIVLAAGIIAFLSSCNGSAISKKLYSSDSLVITFNVPGTDSVINTVSTAEKKAIRKLSGFLEGRKTKESVCGFDGNMIFYSKDEILLAVIFQYSEKNCRHFLFDMDNKVMSTSMSKEAEEFLNSLSKGRNWY